MRKLFWSLLLILGTFQISHAQRDGVIKVRKPLPDIKVTISNLSGGKITKLWLLSPKGLEVNRNDYWVEKFSVLYPVGRRGVQNKIDIEGPFITEGVKKEIGNLPVKSRVYFEEIVVRSSTGILYEVEPMSFIIVGDVEVAIDTAASRSIYNPSVK